jgi:stalled ribosome rescue protein Dom34
LHDLEEKRRGTNAPQRPWGAQPAAPNSFIERKLNMSHTHAVIWTDHQSAQVLQFDAEHVRAQKIQSHSHYTRQHGSTVRTEHEFFGEVCDAVDAGAEVLIAGSHTAIADFRHYVDKHRPHTAPRIVGYEVVDHPSDNQLVAAARKYFLKHDRMGSPRST